MRPTTSFSSIWFHRRRFLFVFLHVWIVGLLIVPSLGILVVAFYKLMPSQTNGTLVFNGSGVTLTGQVNSDNVSQDQITVIWSVGGWGNDYGEGWGPDQTFLGVPNLVVPAVIQMDGNQVFSYDPTKVIGLSGHGFASAQFTSTHTLNAYRNFASLTSMLSSQYFVNVEVTALSPTNGSLPMSLVECGRRGPTLTGWTVESSFAPQVSVTGNSASTGSYILSIVVDVDMWKLSYEVAMAFMIFLGAVITFFATTISVFLVWLKGKSISVGDLLAMPLAIGGTISALRAAFPPISDLERFLDEAVYYPSFVLSVACAVVALGLTRSSFVKIQKRLYRWSVDPYPRPPPNAAGSEREEIILEEAPYIKESPKSSTRLLDSDEKDGSRPGWSRSPTDSTMV